MNPACIQAVQAAAGRPLKPVEIKALEQSLARELRTMATMDRAAFVAMSPDARMAQAAQRAGNRMIHEAAKNRQRVVNRINTHAFLERNGAATFEGMRMLLESDPGNKSGVQSLESRIHATRNLFLSRMMEVWESTDPRIFGLFADRAGERALLLEIFGQDSGSAVAKSAAKVWREQSDVMRQQFNAVGGDVPMREDWAIPQHHSQSRVHKAGQQAWLADTLPLMKREAFVHEDGSVMSGAELTEFLGHAWTTIASGGLNKLDPKFEVSGEGNATRASLSGFKPASGSANVANRGNVARQLHFKDAESYLAYQAKYGDKDLFSVMTSHVGGSAQNIATVQAFGDNPQNMVAYFLARATKTAAGGAEPGNAVKARAARLMSLFDHITGRRDAPANEALARGADAFRQWITAARLGSAVISSISDEATMAVTSRINNVSYMKAFNNELHFFTDPKYRNEARRAGLALDSVISSLNRFGHDGLGSGISPKLANAVMTMQGLNAITDARKAGFGTVMYSAVGKLNGEVARLADLDPTDNAVLLSKGITDRDWAIWKLATRENWGHGNDTMLTPEAVMRIDDAQMDTALRAEAAEGQVQLKQMLDSLAAKDAQEQGWLQKRQDALTDARDRMFGELDQYAERRDLHIVDLRQRAEDLRALLDARVDQAEVESEISKYAAAEAAQGRVVEIVQDVEAGALESDTAMSREAWKATLDASRGGARAGREYGRVKAAATARVAAVEARIRRAEQSGNAEINAKAERIGRTMSERIAELAEYTKRQQERQARRAETAKRMAVAVGQDFDRLRMTARFEAAQKLLGAVLEEVDTAVITPRASERARMLQALGDPQRGTWGGELARSVLLFKSFPIAMMMRHWKRAMSRPTPVSRIKYSAAMIGLTTLAGMASVQIGQLLLGKDPKNMNPFEGKHGVKNWFAAMLKGGSLGFYGDFLFQEQTRYGQGPISALAGPVIGAADELFGLSLGNLNKWRRGEEVHVGAGAVRTIKGMTPGASLWYAKAALDHLVFQQLQEELSPGYLRKMKARSERQFGDSYFWEPGAALPERPPSLGAVVGQ